MVRLLLLLLPLPLLLLLLLLLVLLLVLLVVVVGAWLHLPSSRPACDTPHTGRPLLTAGVHPLLLLPSLRLLQLLELLWWSCRRSSRCCTTGNRFGFCMMRCDGRSAACDTALSMARHLQWPAGPHLPVGLSGMGTRCTHLLQASEPKLWASCNLQTVPWGP
jgi:hypothetical protein